MRKRFSQKRRQNLIEIHFKTESSAQKYYFGGKLNWTSKFSLLPHFETKINRLSPMKVTNNLGEARNPQLEFDGFLLVR